MRKWLKWVLVLIALTLISLLIQVSYESATTVVTPSSPAHTSSSKQGPTLVEPSASTLGDVTSNTSVSQTTPAVVVGGSNVVSLPKSTDILVSSANISNPNVSLLMPDGVWHDTDEWVLDALKRANPRRVPVPFNLSEPVSDPDLSWVHWVRGVGDLPFTKEVQAKIWLHQHPPNCSTVQFLVWKMFQKGLGADMHHVSGALGSAMNLGRVLIVNSTLHGGEWKYARGMGPPCSPDKYFESITNCTLEDVVRSRRPFYGPDWPNIRPADSEMRGNPKFVCTKNWLRSTTNLYAGVNFPAAFENQTVQPPTFLRPARYSLELPNDWVRMGYTWWRAQSMRYLLRPNRWFINHLATVNSEFPEPIRIPPHSISIHVRRSDKVGSFSKGKEMDAVPLQHYMEFAEHIRIVDPKATTVFLSSEDGNVIRQALRDYPHFKFLIVPEDRANLNHDQFVKRFGPLRMMEVSMLNLLFHQQCDYFIHTRKSNWCRVIDELRMTNSRFGTAMVWLNGAASLGPI